MNKYISMPRIEQAARGGVVVVLAEGGKGKGKGKARAGGGGVVVMADEGYEWGISIHWCAHMDI